MSKDFLAGPVGSLEARITPPPETHRRAAQPERWAVLCHPHPQFGGTMDNKVVTTLEKAFQANGMGTATFNFRGVGHSEGEYDNGEGEQNDLRAVVRHLKDHYAAEAITLAGFSFGGYIAAKMHEELQADHLCLVAPAVSLYDFSSVHIHIPWVLIQGGEDEVIPAQEVLAWALKQPSMPDIYWRARSSHFFHRQLVWLKQVVGLSY